MKYGNRNCDRAEQQQHQHQINALISTKENVDRLYVKFDIQSKILLQLKALTSIKQCTLFKK